MNKYEGYVHWIHLLDEEMKRILAIKDKPKDRK